MPYSIRFVRLTNPNNVNLTGYHANDFLPGYSHDEFETFEDALDYIDDHYRGVDSEGVSAVFELVEEVHA